jgi:hypothetical protein
VTIGYPAKLEAYSSGKAGRTQVVRVRAGERVSVRPVETLVSIP